MKGPARGARRILLRVRGLRLTLASVLAVLSSACLVVTLHPVYEPETIAFDPALLGTWVSADEQDQTSLTFERGEWHSYHLLVEGGRDRIRASARLTRADSHLLLDVSPLDGTDVAPLVIPVHVIYRVVIHEQTLTLADLDYEVLEAQLQQGRAGLAAVVDGRKNIVITAGTADLRRWLVSRPEQDDAFSAPAVFKRKAEGPPTPP